MLPIDKETVHTIIEVITVIFMPLLTYFVKNTSRETADKVKETMLLAVKVVQDDVDSVRDDLSKVNTQVNTHDAVSDIKHKNSERRIEELEENYKAIRMFGTSQQRMIKNIAQKVGAQI